MVRDGVSIGPFVIGSLVLHTFGFAAVAHLQGPPRKPPRARVIEVAVLAPKKAPDPRPAPAKATVDSDRPSRRDRSVPSHPETSARRVSKTPVAARTSPRPNPPAPAPRKQEAVPETASRRAEPAHAPASPRAVQMARRALPEAEFPEWRPRPAAPGSGTPAGPGSNRQEEAPGAGMPGPRRLSRARPEVSFPGNSLEETRTLPGGTGHAVPEPLPLGLPIGRRNAGSEPDPGLISRQVGGGSPAAGSSQNPGGGHRAARTPETITFRSGAGGLRLPKATPRIGGGGGAGSVLATGPSTREADQVPVPARPGIGPGRGGGAGAGIGGGLGHSRGRGIGVDAGTHDLATTRRRPGAGIGVASGSGVGAPGPGSGRRASGELPGTGGRQGTGYGSGSGLGAGSGRGIAKARPGLEGIPFGDPTGTPAGGNPAGGGGQGGGPGGPGHGIQMARRGSGTGGSNAGEGGAGIWPGRGSGGSGIGPGTGAGKGAGAGTHPGSGSGARSGGGGGELPGKSGGKAAQPSLPRYAKAVPGLEEWDEEILGRGFYPDGIMGYYYDDPDQTVDHDNPESYLGTPIPEGSTFTRLVTKRKDKRIDFNWNPAGEWGDWTKLLNPLPGINNVYWSARWVGQVFVPKDDLYTFKFDPLDDGGRLYLRYKAGGPLVKVIDAWRVSATRPETRPYWMKRGAYDIQVEYAQRPEFYAAISLKWKSSSFDWEVIGPYRSGGIRRAR